MRFKQYELPELKLFHSTVSPGHRVYQEHHHTECELAMFLRGTGVYTVNGKSFSFQAGDVFLFGSNEIHCITEIFSGEPLDLLNIQFEPRLLWDSGDEATHPLLQLFSNRSDQFTNRIDRSHASTEKIRNYIMDMEKELAEKQPGHVLKVKLTLYSILLHLLRDYGYVCKNADTQPNVRVFGQLSKAIDYIDSHLGDSLTLEEIAQQAMMSKAYFSTVFKKYNGITPWEYISIKRVEKAVKLLKTTDKTKLEIAALCGFNSPAGFYKVFARITGKTPGHYDHSNT